MVVQKIPIPLYRRWDTFKRRGLPMLIWLTAVFGVVQLMDREDGHFQFLGIVAAQEHVVSAPADGLLVALSVGLYQEVAAGDVLAAMDSKPLAARLDIAAAEAERLGAEQSAVLLELTAEVRTAALDWEKDARRFVMDGVGLRVDLLRAKVELESDRVEAERLRVAQERAASLFAGNAGSEADAEDLALAREVVLARVASNEELVSRLQTELDGALARAEEFTAAEPTAMDLSPRLEALRQAVVVQELRFHEMEIARDSLVMRAPVDGVVQSILATPGRSLVLGQDILTLTPRGNGSVVFYQPQMSPATVDVGTMVEVQRLGDTVHAEALVMAVAPGVVELPQSLWRDPSVPEFGRPTSLTPTPALGLAPGEPVRVRLARPISRRAAR